MHQTYRAHYIQHLPASYQHGLASCRAPPVEDRLKETASYRSQLKLSYFLPPESLHQLWLRILQTLEQPGLHDFRDPKLYFSAKGTKLQFKPQTPSQTVLAVMENFKSQLHNVLSFPYVLPEQLYVDMASEICPPNPSRFANPEAATSEKAQTYLWQRCCLKAYLEWLYDGKVPKSNQNIYHNVMLRDACDMTSLTPRRSRLRRGGLLYSQFYSLTKEAIDAAKTFPFHNPGLAALSLDSRLRGSADNIVGSSRRSGVIIGQAYLASKRRCHYSLLGSSKKSFGIREEHRISWPLFLSLMRQLRSMDDNKIGFCAREPPSYVWPLRTDTLFHFIWRNVDKFTTGFELIRARSQPGTTTWEQTKMMEMFLRCLKFSSSSHDYSREGAIWWSRRERPLGTTGKTQVWCGLGFSRTLERYGYCWFEPRIDWSRLVFFPDVTDHVLFGTSTLQTQYLRTGGHVRHFFDITRRVDLALSWLNIHRGEELISDRILDWLVHLCLQQFRLDVLRTVQHELLADHRAELLDDQVRFCYEELRSIFYGDIALVSGNRADFKHPRQLMNALFEFKDGQLREQWEDRPFRTIYRRTRTALRRESDGQEAAIVFERRLRRYLFLYHWILPYPCIPSFMQTTKGGSRMWYSINTHTENQVAVQDSTAGDWYWARKDARPGLPPSLPRYLEWDKDQWKSWIESNRDKRLERPVIEMRQSHLIVQSTLPVTDPGGRRNPRRAVSTRRVANDKADFDDESD